MNPGAGIISLQALFVALIEEQGDTIEGTSDQGSGSIVVVTLQPA
jgi:hypothetical protein